MSFYALLVGRATPETVTEHHRVLPEAARSFPHLSFETSAFESQPHMLERQSDVEYDTSDLSPLCH